MVIIINGRPRVGKDTICDLTKEILGKDYCESISSVDGIKEIAKQIGWNGEKDLRSRKFLSDLKDLFTNFNDYPFISTTRRIQNLIDMYENYGISENQYVIFVHIREPKEIQKIQQKFNALTVIVERPLIDTKVSNHADEEVYNYDYNYIIYNDGNKEDLKKTIIGFLTKIKIKF